MNPKYTGRIDSNQGVNKWVCVEEEGVVVVVEMRFLEMKKTWVGQLYIDIVAIVPWRDGEACTQM